MKVGSLVTWHESCRMELDVGVILSLDDVPYEDEEGIVMAYEGALVMWSRPPRQEWLHQLDLEVLN